MTGELILSSYTYDQGRIGLNNAFSASADFNEAKFIALTSTTLTATVLSAATFSANTIYANGAAVPAIWSGTSDNIMNIGSSATGFGIAIGSGAVASGTFDTSIGGQVNYANGFATTIIGGDNNTIFGTWGIIAGGAQNSMSGGSSAICAGGLNILSGDSSFIGTGYGNRITGNYSSMIGGSGNTINSHYSSIIGGSGNTIASSAVGAIILGMSGYSATTSYRTHMASSYVDSFMDLNPQTTLPTASTGRVFFSGTPLFKLMVNTGGTVADWMIV